jgi:hypothetical protein
LHGRPLLETLRVEKGGVLSGIECLRTTLDKANKQISATTANSLFCDIASSKAVTDMEFGCPHKIIVPSSVRQDCFLSIIEGGTGTSAQPNDLCGGGAAGVLLSTLVSCCTDVRAVAIKNIIICGGGAMIPGVAEAVCRTASMRATEEISGSDQRLERVGCAVRALEGSELKSQVSPFLRSSLAWVGASVFANRKVLIVGLPLKYTNYFFQTNASRFLDAQELGIGKEDEVSLPDWLAEELSSKKFTGGSDPLQEVRIAPVVKLGFKRVSRAGELDDYTTFYG